MGHTGIQAESDRQADRQMRQNRKIGTDDTWDTQTNRQEETDRKAGR